MIKKIASLIGLLLVVGVNSCVLFFASLLATGGDGSADGVYTVLFVGGVFILGFFLVGLYRWQKGQDGITVTAMALPVAYALSVGFIVIAGTLGFHVG